VAGRRSDKPDAKAWTGYIDGEEFAHISKIEEVPQALGCDDPAPPVRSGASWLAWRGFGAEAMSDDDKNLTFLRALRSPDYWLLFASSVAGAAGVRAWLVVLLALAGLSVSSLPKYIALWPRAERAGVERAWWHTVALSMLNNLAAGCAAYLLGIACRWFWF
jgi:hypothetical protein